MPARISPSSGVDPPPESWSAWLGTGLRGDGPRTLGGRRHDAGLAGRPPRSGRRPGPPGRTGRRRTIRRCERGRRRSGMEAMTAARTEPPVSQRVSLAEDRALPRRLQGHRGQGQHVVLREGLGFVSGWFRSGGADGLGADPGGRARRRRGGSRRYVIAATSPRASAPVAALRWETGSDVGRLSCAAQRVSQALRDERRSPAVEGPSRPRPAAPTTSSRAASSEGRATREPTQYTVDRQRAGPRASRPAR